MRIQEFSPSTSLLHCPMHFASSAIKLTYNTHIITEYISVLVYYLPVHPCINKFSVDHMTKQVHIFGDQISIHQLAMAIR